MAPTNAQIHASPIFPVKKTTAGPETILKQVQGKLWQAIG